MTTIYDRDRNGHTAETLRDLGNNKELSIKTWKNFDGSLITVATVSQVHGNSRTYVIGCGIEGDFHRRLATARHARITAKVVRAQHDDCLARLPEILLEAYAHYAAQERSAEQAHA